MAASSKDTPQRRGRGFERASGLLAERIRKAGEGRGFAVSRVLTHWPEIVGQEIAALARPVKVSYGPKRPAGTRRGKRADAAAPDLETTGFGATLTLLATGAAAPIVQMRAPDIRDRVNACYGYPAISHVRVTQIAPEGLAEGAASFAPAPKAAAAPRPEVEARARAAGAGVADPALRAALETLARNVLSRS